MGKIRKHRRKLHQKAPKSQEDAEKTEGMDTDLPKPAGISEFPTSGLFDDTDIDISKLATLTSEMNKDDFDTRSVLTSKSFRGLNISKKKRSKMKKEFWMKKMSAIDTMRKEEKAKKKRKKTVVVGDMKPLEDTLPTLELLMRDTPPSQKQRYNEEKAASKKSIKSEKQRKKDMMSDMAVFKQVLQHPAYKADPLGTISEHLRNKHKMEEMDS